MPLSIAHFAFGYSITIAFLILTTLYRYAVRDMAIGMLGGLWAMIPDINKLHPAFEQLHASPWSDIFFLHYTLDQYAYDFDFVPMVIFISLAIIFTVILLILDWRKDTLKCNFVNGKLKCEK